MNCGLRRASVEQAWEDRCFVKLYYFRDWDPLAGSRDGLECLFLLVRFRDGLF